MSWCVRSVFMACYGKGCLVGQARSYHIHEEPMDDLQRKRLLIEQGQLHSWARRGRGAFTVQHVPFPVSYTHLTLPTILRV